jgi:glycosyltransferase involved in cell wall biosynthesis
MMRIAIFHNLPSGGGKRALFEWVQRLSKKHWIDVYTLSTADHAFCDLRSMVNSYQIIEFKPHKLFRSPLGRLNQFQRWQDLGDLTRLGQGIAKKINSDSYDIVFAHPCLFTSIPTFLQFIDINAVYYLHEPFGRNFSRPFHRPYLKKNKGRKLLDRFDPWINLYNNRLSSLQLKSIQNTKLLLSNSSFTTEQIKREFGQYAPTCNYGVDSENFYPMPELKQVNRVISVGELTPRKGFDFVVESLSHIPAQERPHLVLACNFIDPSEEAYIQELSERFEVSLEVLTNLSASELAVEYNKAQLCVYAPVLEPFGLVPLEAMACGTAVVGVKEGGVQESILHGRTGLLVERNPKKFAQAVQHLLSNPGLASDYGRNGREHVVKNWTWENSTLKLEEYLIACAELP